MPLMFDCGPVLCCSVKDKLCLFERSTTLKSNLSTQYWGLLLIEDRLSLPSSPNGDTKTITKSLRERGYVNNIW